MNDKIIDIVQIIPLIKIIIKNTICYNLSTVMCSKWTDNERRLKRQMKLEERNSEGKTAPASYKLEYNFTFHLDISQIEWSQHSEVNIAGWCLHSSAMNWNKSKTNGVLWEMVGGKMKYEICIKSIKGCRNFCSSLLNCSYNWRSRISLNNHYLCICLEYKGQQQRHNRPVLTHLDSPVPLWLRHLLPGPLLPLHLFSPAALP